MKYRWRRKVMSGSEVPNVIRSFVNSRSLQFGCARLLREGLARICFNVWEEKVKSRMGLYRWIT